MKRRYISLFLFIISFNILVLSVKAGTTGKLTGTIKDAETGELLPGVNVMIEGTSMGAATDFDGHYIILNVPPGKYNIKASMIGYQTQIVSGATVSIDFTTTIDFEISIKSLELGEEVVVIAGRELVRKDLTSSSAVIGADEITQMPVENFTEIIEQQSGVIAGADGKIHIRGGRASEVAYMVNGVSVTDPFSGDVISEVENTGIQEIQVISGTFNAEYGQAMSGVVEIVTKKGGDNLTGYFSSYMGSYVSNQNELYLNSDNISPFNIYNFQASLSGPVFNKLYFFATGRIYNNSGWLYGQRVFNPTDSSDFNAANSEEWYIESTGDNKIVPMNYNNKNTAQANLTYRFSPTLVLSYEALWSNGEARGYNHAFKYNPDGDYKQFSNSLAHFIDLNHTINSTTFYSVKLSHSSFEHESYVYENPLDSRYVDPRLLRGTFRTGGTEMNHQYRSTKTFIGKVDFTTQLTKTHMVKTGFEIRSHDMWLHEFEIKYDRSTDWKPEMPADTIGVLKNNQYSHNPIEGSFYIQDKMEFENIIINAGIRYDYFDPSGFVPVDEYYQTTEDGEKILREGDRDPQNAPKEVAKANHQISPRIGVSYPITDRGVIHFSYGHFYQTPPFEYLYHNSEFEVEMGGLQSLMGNAELKPQQTVIYELGLQQQLTDDIGLDITGFYKDIRNLLGTEIINTYTATKLYAKYVNRDYGNVRGVTLSLEKRSAGLLSARLNYTFQVSEGNASDPNSVFLDNQASPPRESEIKVVPLDWDQTHTLNFSLILSEPNDWGVSLLTQLGSGLPYTPSLQGIRTSYENSERKPINITVNLNAHKDFNFGGLTASVFLKVYNLLDTQNEITVYEDTGRAGYSLQSFYQGDWRNYSSLDDYLTRPEYYSEPRQIILGMTIGF